MKTQSPRGRAKSLSLDAPCLGVCSKFSDALTKTLMFMEHLTVRKTLVNAWLSLNTKTAL